MALNNSLIDRNIMQEQVIITQVLVIIFLSINLLLITTFFRKECFYTTTRYILFAVTLLSDSLTLFISDILLLLVFRQVTIHVSACIIISIVTQVYFMLTPVTLTAMTLERYVAICMPLRHGELCSTRSTIHCILIIQGLSSVPAVASFSVFFASAPLSLYTKNLPCNLRIFILYRWQNHFKSAVYQFYFLVMCIIIVFSYIKIIKVARTASGEDKKSTNKGLRTVVLHGFQLLLCLIQLWTPFIETAVFQIDFKLYLNLRYFNYVMFGLVPRCLNPLIYGLRDEAFFTALKNMYHLACVKETVDRAEDFTVKPVHYMCDQTQFQMF